MTAPIVRAAHDGARPFPAARIRVAGDLELPRTLRLLLTAAWSLAESIGPPLAAYVLAAWPGGRDAGLVARRIAVTGPVPSLLTISAVVLTRQAAVVLATGDVTPAKAGQGCWQVQS